VEVTAQHRYSKGVDVVFRFFSDPQLLKAKYESVGARNIQVLESTEQGELHVVRTLREVPAEVPGFLSKLFSSWNKVTQSDRWQHKDGARSCQFTIDVSGAPVKIGGTMALRPEADGCVNDVRITIECSIPLLGRKIMDLVAASTRQGMESEYAYIRGQLG
jgi:hypothetical protein